jgi:hypothetical protein
MKHLTAIIALLSLIGIALAQQAAAPKPLALTDAEVAEAAAARQAVEQAVAARSQAWALIQQTPVTDCAKVTAALSVAKQIEAGVAIAEARRDAVLAQQRANHLCPRCEWAEDAKALVRGK